ncbi:MAG: hypothetical protein HPY83_03000 [Anaerolineae bacterium]|nr:hypothetical protein [Anaerolineae bacterium]
MTSLAAGSRTMAVMICLILLLAATIGLASCASATGDVLTYDLVEPLNGVTSARFNIDAGNGNLTIDWLTGGEPLLAGGTLQYLERQGQPMRTLVSFLGEATLTLEGGDQGQSWFRLPWAACNGATEWNIHLNPTVSSDITAHSNGGNVRLNLASMAVTRVTADTGGGNMEVILPDNATNLTVSAKTGAGNVLVSLPSGLAARIHATTGLGKVIVDPSFSQTDKHTYQSSDYDTAANRVELTLSSGAGNVNVTTN